MYYAILPRSSHLNKAAIPLIDSGALRLLSYLSQIDLLGHGDFVLLHVGEAEGWLKPLTERCRAGRLGSIRVLVEEGLPRWEAIGFRVRPWVQSIVMLGSCRVPAGAVPAPVRLAGTLKEALDDWLKPAFRPGDLPTPFPPKVQIETTARCANKCPYCPASSRVKPDRALMPEELYRRLVEECAQGRPDSIELYLNGDPLNDRRLERFADLAKESCPESLIEIITHERSIGDLRAKRLAESGLDVVFVSVNFHEPADAAEMRKRLGRVARLREIFISRGKQLIVVTLMNLMDDRRAGEFTAIMDELGLPFERFRATGRLGDADLGGHTASARRAEPAPRVCERPFTKAYVRANGKVLLCCEDWNDRWVLGNVKDRPLGEIWSSSPYRELRRALMEGRPPAPCNRCEYAGGSTLATE